MKPHHFAAGLLATLAISAHAADKAPHWSYQGKTAPEKWGGLDESFATCKIGKNSTCVKARLPQLP